MGLPYDSPEGRGVAGAITAIECGEAYARSAEIAANPEIGPFNGFPENREPMLEVMNMHRDAVEDIDPTCPDYLQDAAQATWDRCVALGEEHGYRNAQATVLAPTGTIGFYMDCDTTGIEPDFALVKYKLLAGEGEGMFKIVNQSVPMALERLGYDETEREEIIDYIDDNDTIEGAPHLDGEHLPVFDCAFKPANGERSIHHLGHIRMMGAAQPFISGAISKTVNMPETATVEEIADAYHKGWELGLKALAIYRENSKRSQPLSTSKDGNTQKQDEEAAQPETAGDGMAGEEPEIVEKIVEKEKVVHKPMRKRLPDERPSITHKFSIAGHEGYLHIGMYPDTNMPGEIFITKAKQGSTIAGVMDAFATAISLALQYGVPLEDLCTKFSHMRFEPSGFTGNQEIPIATSIMDYLFRWLSLRFVGDEAHPAVTVSGGQLDLPNVPVLADEDKTSGAENGAGKPIVIEAAAQSGFVTETDAPPCHECGTLMVRNGACHKCPNCGATSGCS
jgi:ribonucleoside-diphosphate reductase alpha chain